MYEDEDGIATKQSEAVYATRTRLLLFMNAVLSWLGFGAAILHGEYDRDDLHLLFSSGLSGLCGWTSFLWVS